MAQLLLDRDPRQLRLKTWPWWHSDLGNKLTPEGRQILEDCGVPSDQVEAHIHTVRGKAWEVFPFPCIGEFWFVEFGLTHHPRFPEVVQRLKELANSSSFDHPAKPHNSAKIHDTGVSVVDTITQNRSGGPRLLDIGTCVGQDLRVFRHYGVPKQCLYGTDVFPGFEAIGHELFLDAESFAGRFIAADVFDDGPNSPLNSTAGSWDFVSATMFTHQFDLDEQRIIARRMVRLLRPTQGSAILGTSTGQLDATRIPLRPPFCERPGEKCIYRQSKETMRELWVGALAECGEEASGWEVVCEYDEKQVAARAREQKEQGEVRFFQGDGQRRIFFWIRRLR